MSTDGAPPRLSPEQMQIVLLDEIAARLQDLTAKGQLSSYSVTVGTSWHPIIGGWISSTLFNDGDSDVYVRLRNDVGKGSPWEEGEAPVKKGEHINIDLKGRKVKTEGGVPEVWLICQTGTASVRIFQLF